MTGYDYYSKNKILMNLAISNIVQKFMESKESIKEVLPNGTMNGNKESFDDFMMWSVISKSVETILARDIDPDSENGEDKFWAFNIHFHE